MYPKCFFVTGTDTGVGKSMVSAILALGLNAEYWKPIQCGILPQTDSEWIKEITGLSSDHFHPEKFRLIQPLSPHAAALHENIHIDLSEIQMPNAPKAHSHLIIEGAGGVLVPLNESDFMIDLIAKLQVPVLLVSRSTLGTINHTLLTLQQLRAYSIPILGVVLNGPKNEGNRKAIVHYGQVDILAELEPISDMTPDTLHFAFNQNFNK